MFMKLSGPRVVLNFFRPVFSQGTKIRLIPEVITSLDPDTPAQELQFTVLPMEPQGGSLQGYLELSSEPGKSILSFTQADLEANRVW